MAVERVFHLERADVLAAGDDDVLAAVLDLDVAVGLQHREVAGVEPAAGERRIGRLPVLQVAAHHDVASEHDLAHGLAVGRHFAQGLGMHHGHAFLERVANALAAVEARLLGEGFRRPRFAPHRDRRRPVDLGETVDVRDVEADPRHAFDHRRRRRGAGDHRAHLVVDAFAHRRRRGDQQVVDDRRRAVVIDALAPDRLEDRLRLDLAQAHVHAAEQGHGPREAPAVAVEHRQRPQVARKVRHRPGGRVAHGVEVRAAVMRDHAFRVAGGARGVRDRDRIPLVGRAAEMRQRLVRGDQSFVLVRAEALAGTGELAVADVDDDRGATVLFLQQPQCLLHRRRQLAIGEEHGRLAMVHLPGDKRRIEPRVERVEHGVEGGHGVVRLDHLGRVVKHRAHRRAAADAERLQRRRQSRRTVARFAPAIAARAMHDRLEIAEHLGAALDKADGRQRDEVRRVLVEILVVDAHTVQTADAARA